MDSNSWYVNLKDNKLRRVGVLLLVSLVEENYGVRLYMSRYRFKFGNEG